MLFEILLGVVLLFSVINLLLCWLSLNLQVEIREGFLAYLESQPNASSNLNAVAKKINDIENFLREMTDAMGNPFQMLAATHGHRIIEHFFPPKIEPLVDPDRQSDHDPLLSTPSSATSWQDVEQNLNAEEVEAEELN